MLVKQRQRGAHPAAAQNLINSCSYRVQEVGPIQYRYPCWGVSNAPDGPGDAVHADGGGLAPGQRLDQLLVAGRVQVAEKAVGYRKIIRRPGIIPDVKVLVLKAAQASIECLITAYGDVGGDVRKYGDKLI